MKTVTIDIETSGLVPKDAKYETDYMRFPRILSIAWKINDEPHKEFIINQEEFLIPAEATKINGITQEMCDSSSNLLEDILRLLINDLDDCDLIIGFNLYFDTSIIKANANRLHSNSKLIDEIIIRLSNNLHKDKRIDCMRICAKLWGDKWPTMSEAYFKLFQEKFNAHSAGEDVKACYRIYQKLVELNLIKYPEQKGMDI